MRRITDSKAIRPVLKVCVAFAAMLLAVIGCLSHLNSIRVNAEPEVVISAVTKSTDIGPGDLLIVNVVANNFPGITGFGPIVFNFDADKAEYVSFEQGKDLSNYIFTETLEDGTLTVTGMDQMMNMIIDENEEEVATSSFSSDNQVTLFTILLRIYPESKGEINCWLSSSGEFNTPAGNVPSRIGSGLTVPIRRAAISSDATIAFLKIRGTSITPEFNPNITDYSCSVERSVTDIQVNVTTMNLWAAVVINGNQNLNLGDNVVSIDVTAQDGISRMHYTIHVTRKESNIPDNASLVDNAGNTYTFLDFPEEIQVPAGFTQTSRYINGYTVPVYAKEGVSSVILYLFDGNQSPGFYFYNLDAKTVLRYDPDNTLIESSKVLKMVPVPSDYKIPDEFKPAVYDTGSMILSGYANSDGDFICYLSDENGNEDFYHINLSDGSINLYRFADKKAELLYSYLFDVFLVITIIEAVIITITVYIIRRMVSDRTNPRPKRV